MSTPIGFVIKAGEAIPEDVMAYRDARGGAAMRTPGIGGPWVSAHCRGLCEGHEDEDLDRPLTVTAVRPQPVDDEPKPHLYGVLAHHPFAASAALEGRCDHETGGGFICGRPADDPLHRELAESVDLLDLVRQYCDKLVAMTMAAAIGEESAPFGAGADAVFARIEAEVNRLRSEKDRAFDEVNAITALLNEAEVASASPSGRVTFAIDSMRRGWATATENLARLDTVKADRETIRGALNHLKDTVTRPAIKALGVQHNEHIVPAIERLKNDLRAVDDLVQDDLMQRPDPLVLSLPEGTAALVGVRSGRRYLRRAPHVWEPDEADSTLHGLQQVLEREGSVRVEMAPPREPRTWEPLEAAEEGLKVRGASGNVYTFSGVISGRRAHVEKIGDRFMGCWMSLAELREMDGPLTEVLDEPDGAR